MTKNQYHIGIIDDDPSKITQMITCIRLCCNDEDGNPIKAKYANCELIPVELELTGSMDDMVERIIEKRLDAVIIDYKLSSQRAISYSGVSLANELHLRLWRFPVFVLLSWQLNNRQLNNIKFNAVLLAPCGATAKHGKYYFGNP